MVVLAATGARLPGASRPLHESPVREYVERRFEIVNVNIGTRTLTGDRQGLGVSLKKGVPAAAFFTPDGKPIDSPIR